VVLRRSEDLRSLAFEILTLGSLAGILVIPFSVAILPLIPPLAFLCFASCVINHNNKHHPVFRSRALNGLNDLVVSLCIGAPATRLHIVHHENHHREFRNGDDWSGYWLAGERRGARRLVAYWIASTRAMFRNRSRLRSTEIYRRALARERTALWIAALVALVCNPVSFLVVIVPSWLLGQTAILTANFLNHDGCDLSDEWGFARNFVSCTENWFLFNGGYHTAHHLRPEAHWAELPALHARWVEGHVARSLIEGSFFSYLFRRYLLPPANVLAAYLKWYALVGALFTLVYAAAACHSLGDVAHHRFAFSWEVSLPLVPEAAWIYLSIFALFVMPPFFLDERRIRQLGLSLCVAVMVAGVAFFLFPAPVLWREHGPVVTGHALLDFIYRFDVRANSLPSLHVAFSAGIVSFVSPEAGWLRPVFWGWLALIMVSVVLVHQHHILDAVAGLALALVVGSLVKRLDARSLV
jgi:fatty acid desaturase/membrane-associated phospholipid phosphatase